MKPVLVKICGLRRAEEIQWVNRERPAMAGFVFYRKSRRCISPQEAEALRTQLSREILPVGVFVDAEPEEILFCVRKGIIDGIQLHGHESPAYIAALKSLLEAEGLRAPGRGASEMERMELNGRGWILQAFSAENPAALKAAEASPADMILVDHGSGGSGECFDWRMLQTLHRPFLLAGGLNPENVTEALKQVKPAGVDVSSGVETDGRKDPVKIRRFMEAVRRQNTAEEG